MCTHVVSEWDLLIANEYLGPNFWWTFVLSSKFVCHLASNQHKLLVCQVNGKFWMWHHHRFVSYEGRGCGKTEASEWDELANAWSRWMYPLSHVCYVTSLLVADFEAQNQAAATRTTRKPITTHSSVFPTAQSGVHLRKPPFSKQASPSSPSSSVPPSLSHGPSVNHMDDEGKHLPMSGTTMDGKLLFSIRQKLLFS